MSTIRKKLRSCCVGVLVATALCHTARAEDTLQFNRDIRPILSEHCFACHGPDEENRQADLRLDVGNNSAESVESSEIDAGLLLERIHSKDPELMMPPPSARKPLSAQQRETLRRWIQQGAPYEQHWAFLPIRRVETPVGQHAIDYFIQQRLLSSGMQLSAPADRETLIRRVTLDLTGLPPTPEEIAQFVNDDRSDCYERVVERLLNSKHFGEHMALPWLEAARYADTSGYQADWERFMWPWRNWVINAFNSNMPFDQFTIEQLAGDMLPDASQDQILATGFNRNHRINDEGGVIAAEYAVEYVVDRVDTTSTVWLGLTMGCSRCHDHKYDPLPQQDFYNMFALFNNVPEKGKDGRLGYSLPVLDFPNPDVQQVLDELKRQRTSINDRLKAAARNAQTERAAWESKLRKEVTATEVPQWRLLQPAKVSGTQGVSFQDLSDGSFLRSGANPANSTYQMIISAEELSRTFSDPITGFRLEALTHESLTGNSLAASSNGNFVLSEFRVEILRGQETVAVGLSKAVADHSQDQYPAQNAIDGNMSTGWAVEGHVKKENRTLVVSLSAPYEAKEGDRLRLQLHHASQFAQHVIGRFRLSATTVSTPTLDAQSTLPSLVMAALSSKERKARESAALDDYFRSTHPAFQDLRQQRSDLDKQIAEQQKGQFVKVMVMSEMEQPRSTFVLTRGVYDQPDEERPATPDAPAVFGGLGKHPRNRLGFAQWLVSKENPLTARVAVNRFWQQFFGRGIVETVEDFGSQGTPPSHPELLDWLATEFRDSGWNVKQILKLIVTSNTYRQSSAVTQQHLDKDPKNILLARAPRVRLSGYQLRDQALAAGGLLVRKVGGPSVRPYQPPGLWSEVSFQSKGRSTDFYVQDHGDALYRRGLYTFWKRSVAPPMLANFDAAGREMCTVRAVRTSTPLQALNLMNDVTFVEAARAMGQRMLLEGGAHSKQQIGYGMSLLGLKPTEAKTEMLTTAYSRYLAWFQENSSAAVDFLSNGEWAQDSSLDNTQLAAMTAVASVLLNLDEVIVRQ